jgi:hypothetical protein
MNTFEMTTREEFNALHQTSQEEIREFLKDACDNELQVSIQLQNITIGDDELVLYGCYSKTPDEVDSYLWGYCNPKSLFDLVQ